MDNYDSDGDHGGSDNYDEPGEGNSDDSERSRDYESEQADEEGLQGEND